MGFFEDFKVYSRRWAHLTEVGIYKRKQGSRKDKKHTFDQESDKEKNEKNPKTGQEKKRKTKKVRFKKKLYKRSR